LPLILWGGSLDNDKLLISPHKSRLLLAAAFVVMGLMVAAVLWSAYAGITHQQVIPDSIAKAFGAGKAQKIAVIYVEGRWSRTRARMPLKARHFQRHSEVHARRHGATRA